LGSSSTSRILALSGMVLERVERKLLFEALQRVELRFERLSALALLVERGAHAGELLGQLFVPVSRLAQAIRERLVLGGCVYALAEQVQQQSRERGVRVVTRRSALDDFAEDARRLIDIVIRRIRGAQQQREANRRLVRPAFVVVGETLILLRQIGAERSAHAIAEAYKIQQIARIRRDTLHRLDLRRRHLVALTAGRDECGEQKRC